MIDPRKRAELEQGQELACEIMPALLYKFYKALVHQGFTPGQAVDLTQTWLNGVMLRPIPPEEQRP